MQYVQISFFLTALIASRACTCFGSLIMQSPPFFKLKLQCAKYNYLPLASVVFTVVKVNKLWQKITVILMAHMCVSINCYCYPLYYNFTSVIIVTHTQTWLQVTHKTTQLQIWLPLTVKCGIGTLFQHLPSYKTLWKCTADQEHMNTNKNTYEH